MSAKTKKTIQIVLSIFLIAIGFLIARHLILTKPRLKVRKHLAPLPMVKVMKVKLSPHRIIIDADGTVRAVKEISLVSLSPTEFLSQIVSKKLSIHPFNKSSNVSATILYPAPAV